MTDCRPKILLIGGPDVDTRIDLMCRLQHKYQVQVAGTDPGLAQKFAEYDFKYHYYPLAKMLNPFSYLASLLALLSVIRKVSPHVVHTFDTKPSILGRLAAKLAGVPVTIATITGLGSLYIIQGEFFPVLIRPIYESIQRILCEISDLTVFYTQDDAEFFLSKGLTKQSKIAIIPGSGVMLDRFSPERFPDRKSEDTRLEIGIPAGNIVVTMIARLVRSKGVILFAEIAQRVQAQIPTTNFLLIGSHDMESLDSLSLNEVNWVSEVVNWIGPKQQVEKYLAISDIFLLPSDREGIPRVLIEAAAMELPLIATDLPGCREVILEGRNGYLIPQNDLSAFEQAIIHLIAHPELRKQFGTSSRNYVLENFDLTKISTMLMDIYQKFLTQKGVIDELEA